MNSESSNFCYFPNLLNILNSLIEIFPNDNVSQNRNNRFVVDCLSSIENTVEQRKYYQPTSPIELLSYAIFLIIANHCLIDGNKRFFSIFFIEFIEQNREIILKEFWTDIRIDSKVELTLELFSQIEIKIKENEPIETIFDYIALWVMKFLILK